MYLNAVGLGCLLIRRVLNLRAVLISALKISGAAGECTLLIVELFVAYRDQLMRRIENCFFVDILLPAWGQ